MNMTEKDIEELWEFWIGSKMLVPAGNRKSLIRPKNFMGSVERHKKLFMEATREFLQHRKSAI